MDTIIAQREKGQYEQGIIATLSDKRHFHLVFDQRLDVDIQPEREDFSFILGADGEQKVAVESLKLSSGERDGQVWSVISFVLREPIAVGTPLIIRYQPRQVFLWSEDQDDVVEAFEITATAEATNALRASDLHSKDFQSNAAEAEADIEEERWLKPELRVIEACDRSIRIGFKHKLDLRLRSRPEDFRAESNTRWLTIERVFLHPGAQGTELCLFLKERIEGDSNVEIAYKSSVASLQTIHGEKIENFRVEARADADEVEQPTQEEAAFADIDEILGLVEDEDPQVDKHNVVPLFADERHQENLEGAAGENGENPVLAEAQPGIEQSGDSQNISQQEAGQQSDSQPGSDVDKVEPTSKSQARKAEVRTEEVESEHSLQKSILSDRVLIQSKGPRDFITAPALTRAIEIKADHAQPSGEQDEILVEPETAEHLPADQAAKLGFFEKIKQLEPVSLGILGAGCVLATWVLLALLHFASLIFSLNDSTNPQSLTQIAATPDEATIEAAAALTASPQVAPTGAQAEPCERRYKDGSHFNGTCLNGLRHGGGNLTYANGDSYSGEWQDDRQHGTGMMKYANGGMYAGAYHEGLMHGRGTYRWADGRLYEGEFENEAFHGQGKLVETDGRFFEGLFEYGEAVEGVCTLPGGVRINGACDSF